MTISSRTPEGSPGHCPVCDALVCLEPSRPYGDAPCPQCGTLLWFCQLPPGTWFHEAEKVAPIRRRLERTIAKYFGPVPQEVPESASFHRDWMADSLDQVELVMALEEEFNITIPAEDAEKLSTVGEALDYLMGHLP